MTPASTYLDGPLRVGVVPGAQRALRARLFAALEALYPVRFVPHDSARIEDVDAVVCVGEQTPAVVE